MYWLEIFESRKGVEVMGSWVVFVQLGVFHPQLCLKHFFTLFWIGLSNVLIYSRMAIYIII